MEDAQYTQIAPDMVERRDVECSKNDSESLLSHDSFFNGMFLRNMTL